MFINSKSRSLNNNAQQLADPRTEIIDQEIQCFSGNASYKLLHQLPKKGRLQVDAVKRNVQCINAYLADITIKGADPVYLMAILTLLENAVYQKNGLALYLAGMLCWKSGQYQKALAYAQQSIEYRCEEGKSLLGKLYYRGGEIPCDLKKAFEYFSVWDFTQRANGLLDDEVIIMFAMICYQGCEGVRANPKKAYQLILLLSQSNEHMVAKVFLAKMLFEGKIGVRDYIQGRMLCEEAIALFEKSQTVRQAFAAAESYAEANFILGKIYYKGKGIAQDFEKAREYFEKAAELSFPGANAYLGSLYLFGIGGVSVDQAKALSCFQAEIKIDPLNKKANLALATIYSDEQGVKPDMILARQHLEIVAEQTGGERFYEVIGQMYSDDPSDFEKALIYFEMAAQKGSVSAQHAAAMLHQYREFGQKAENKAKAIYHLLQAAKQGYYPSIMALIGYCSEIPMEELEKEVPWIRVVEHPNLSITEHSSPDSSLKDHEVENFFENVDQITTAIEAIDIVSALRPESATHASPRTLHALEESSSMTGPSVFKLPTMENERLDPQTRRSRVEEYRHYLQKQCVYMQSTDKRLKSSNQKIVNRIFRMDMKLTLEHCLNLFADPFFRGRIKVTWEGHKFKIKDSQRKENNTGTHTPHNGKEIDKNFLRHLGGVLKDFEVKPS